MHKWNDKKQGTGLRKQTALRTFLSHRPLSTPSIVAPTSAAFSSFSLAQKRVFELVMHQKRNVFFTGSAGTGKSFLLQQMLTALPKATTFVTASTGLAALNIGGMTLHSFAAIGLGQESAEAVVAKMPKRQRDRWRLCRLLIIDEISMIGGPLFDLIEEVARRVRKNDAPFGGVRLVICGDFLQLPPVDEPIFAFQARTWSHCVDEQVELTQVFRQTDSSLVALLTALRFGQVPLAFADILKARLQSDSDAAALQSRLSSPSPAAAAGIEPTVLYPHKRSVAHENEQKLRQLTGASHFFDAVDSGRLYDLQALDKHCPAPKRLELKVGAQVILLKNLDPRRGLVNGSRGVIKAFEPDRKITRPPPTSGSTCAPPEESVVTPTTSEEDPKTLYPIVHFANGIQEQLSRETWEVTAGNEVLAGRQQVPLALAWALTIHKCQGMSLDQARMALGDCFEYGQLYVAVSRIRTLEGLVLTSFDAEKCRANPTVLEYYATQFSAVWSSEEPITTKEVTTSIKEGVEGGMSH